MTAGLVNDLYEFSRQDRFDSREAQDRIDELEAREDDDETPLDEDEKTELKAWRELVEEAEGYSGDRWRDGIFFISEESFEDYAEELASDIGAIDRDADWPLSFIDWTRAADALKQDYTSTEIYGNEFWYR